VEEWRGGVAVSTPRSSNRTCGFFAFRFRTRGCLAFVHGRACFNWRVLDRCVPKFAGRQRQMNSPKNEARYVGRYGCACDWEEKCASTWLARWATRKEVQSRGYSSASKGNSKISRYFPLGSLSLKANLRRSCQVSRVDPVKHNDLVKCQELTPLSTRFEEG